VCGCFSGMADHDLERGCSGGDDDWEDTSRT
jgi:hypothetical protein